MDSRKRELTRAQSLQTALKVKDSKTGQMILRGNVFEETKLEGEISQINLRQKKEACRLKWEKEYAIRGLRKNLLTSRKSNPDVLSLPPIAEGMSRNLGRKRFDERRHSSLAYLSSDDSSPERSPYSSLEDIVKTRSRKRASIPTNTELTSLPALLSPHLMRRAATSDPRFTNLMRQLVPKAEVKISSENASHQGEIAKKQGTTEEDEKRI